MKRKLSTYMKYKRFISKQSPSCKCYSSWGKRDLNNKRRVCRSPWRSAKRSIVGRKRKSGLKKHEIKKIRKSISCYVRPRRGNRKIYIGRNGGRYFIVHGIKHYLQPNEKI